MHDGGDEDDDNSYHDGDDGGDDKSYHYGGDSKETNGRTNYSMKINDCDNFSNVFVNYDVVDDDNDHDDSNIMITMLKSRILIIKTTTKIHNIHDN